MIVSFKDQATEDIFNGVSSKKASGIPSVIWRIAQRKLDMLNSAHELIDLRVPPGNRLEALKGKFQGYYSIRINDQYRIIFKWAPSSVTDVQITDYH